jgi:hypothetical protein
VDLDAADGDRDSEPAGMELGDAGDADAAREDREVQPLECVDVADGTIHHQSEDPARLGGDGEDLAPVPVPGALQVGDVNVSR